MTVGNTPIILPLGKGVGGTTMINSGTCFRTPEPVLEMWGERFGLDELNAAELDPYFRRVERELNVVQVPEDRAGPQRARREARRGRARLERRLHLAQRARLRRLGRVQLRLPDVGEAARRAELRAARVGGGRDDVHRVPRRADRPRRPPRARGARARPRAAARVRVECSHVVVACGAIHTPLFLARQGLGARSGELGRNLAIHPATAVRALFDEEIDMANGVPQSYFIDEFADEGIMLEGAAGPPDYAAMSFPFAGEKHRELMLQFRNISQFGLMVSDLSRGWVRERAGRVEIRYDLNREDTATFKRGIERLCELYVAAGARAIYPPVTGVAGADRRRPRAATPRRGARAGPRADGVPPARHRARRRAPGPRRRERTTCAFTRWRTSGSPTRA